jgi:hypothetical protein
MHKYYVRHAGICSTEGNRPSTSEENIQMQRLQKFVVPPLIPTLLGFVNCSDVDIYNISGSFSTFRSGKFALFCDSCLESKGAKNNSR